MVQNNHRDVSIYFLKTDRGAIEAIIKTGSNNHIEYAENSFENIFEAKIYDGALSKFLKYGCDIGRVSILDETQKPMVTQIKILSEKARGKRIRNIQKLESCSIREVIRDYQAFYRTLLVPYIPLNSEKMREANQGIILIE